MNCIFYSVTFCVRGLKIARAHFLGAAQGKNTNANVLWCPWTGSFPTLANHISFNQFICAVASCIMFSPLAVCCVFVHNQLHCTLWCIDARIANKSYQEQQRCRSLGSKFSFSVHLSFHCSHRRSTKTCSGGQNKRLEKNAMPSFFFFSCADNNAITPQISPETALGKMRLHDKFRKLYLSLCMTA
jgi:hypothetical protein